MTTTNKEFEDVHRLRAPVVFYFAINIVPACPVFNSLRNHFWIPLLLFRLH
jgi:hypothetical protein